MPKMIKSNQIRMKIRDRLYITVFGHLILVALKMKIY